MDYKKAGVDIEAITDIHIMKMNAVLLNESCAAICRTDERTRKENHERRGTWWIRRIFRSIFFKEDQRYG